MKLVAQIGSIRRQMDRDIRMAERAVRGGVADATAELQARIRSQTTSAGLGSRLARTWRKNVKPKTPSLTADGMVWTKAPQIMRAHAFGARIKARRGVFLAIPAKAAGKGKRGLRISPELWEKRTGLKLQYVPARGGKPALLVTDRATGSYTKRGVARTTRAANPRNPKTEVIFFLVRQVSLRRRLHIEGAAHAAVQAIPRYIDRRWHPSGGR